MPILYHYPMSCSTACRMVAAEAQAPLDTRTIDIVTKDIRGGGNLFDINPLGQVGTLAFEDGSILTENNAMMLYLQSSATNGFGRSSADEDYYSLVSWLGFCATELHKAIIWQLVRSDTSEPAKDMARTLVSGRLAVLETAFANRDTLLESGPSAADCYFLWSMILLQFCGVSLTAYPNLSRAIAVVQSRPAIAKVLREDMQASAALRAQGSSSLVATQAPRP